MQREHLVLPLDNISPFSLGPENSCLYTDGFSKWPWSADMKSFCKKYPIKYKFTHDFF